MCGINGIFGLKDDSGARRVASMNSCLSHRGPDDEGQFIDDGIALGHRRLSIIDLSAAGHQPLSSFDKRYHIVYNGELYNYRELRFELQRVTAGSGEKAYFFQTETDTEVILAAFVRWGAKCLRYFNGMYAFAIWDSQTGELFIARDRLGIKPLYYVYVEGVLAFSSELRSVLRSGLVEARLDRNALADYLRYQTVHAPSTMVKGVKMLMPGHYMRCKGNDVRIHQYWHPSTDHVKEAESRSYNEICDDVKHLLSASVERRMIADVPFGAFLSGGIDSSSVVALMSRISSTPVRTFCVAFDESEFSESSYAATVARKFNTHHEEILLRPADFLHQLPSALNAMDHPSGDGPNTYVVSGATKQAGITMALSGLGGDELFAGYDVFRRAQTLKKREWLSAVPQPMRAVGGRMLRLARPGVAAEKIAALLSARTINYNSFYALSRQVMSETQIKRLLPSGDSPNQVLRILEESSLDELSTLSKVSVSEISTYMQNVLLRDTDQMSMKHALEVRVPFLDYKLVEYVLGIPDKYKTGARPKQLLVDAMGDLLPPEIVNRSKMGFSFPWKKWMTNELRDFCSQRIETLAARELMEPAAVRSLWKDFLKGDPAVPWIRVWILVVLENWIQQNDIR
jgi:asparagine synthase (glutamine-hydrolysing)